MEPLEAAKLNLDYIQIVSFYLTENTVFLYGANAVYCRHNTKHYYGISILNQALYVAYVNT